ncbi:MAG: ribose 5-phosphate isomerase B [Candidatus Omnitrophota bacterium]
MTKIIIGSDHAGFKLKNILVSYLKKKKNFIIKDVGTCNEESCDYPLFAAHVAKGVSSGIYKRGILICKSGIGNSIVANKFPRVRAALCYNLAQVKLSRQHNDSNILVLGASFTKPALAKKMVNVWLGEKFEGGRHKRRVDQIRSIEKRVGL